MKRQVWHFICGVLLIALVLGKGEVTLRAGIEPEEEPPQAQQTQSSNLLLNGSMEDGFYWLYPNHYIANNWTRWWLGSVIPEYDDVREWRPYKYDGEPCANLFLELALYRWYLSAGCRTALYVLPVRHVWAEPL